MRLVHTITDDELKLPGFASALGSEAGLVLTNGMAGGIIHNPWADTLSQRLEEAGLGFVYGYNRGAGHIIDFPVQAKGSTAGMSGRRRVGLSHERFADCALDIAAWMEFAAAAGWKKIFLAGYSMGGTKVIYSYPRIDRTRLAGVALLSPADMVGLGKRAEVAGSDSLSAVLPKARQLVADGQSANLCNLEFYGFPLSLSAATVTDLFEENGPADVIPLHRHPDSIPTLAQIRDPLLVILGGCDSIITDTPEQDTAAIRDYARQAANVETHIIPGARHTYENHEPELAAIITGWMDRCLRCPVACPPAPKA